MKRSELRARLDGREGPFDLIVVGGGATGVGVALDAASRGHSVALFEQADFGKGTSSRSTKLVHGGVRYLAQGNLTLVMEALRERGRLRANAPHLVHDLRFVVPSYEWWESPWYGMGLKMYDLLAGRYGFGRSRLLSREQTLEAIPTLRTDGLRGGVLYHDGQFDDARLLMAMVASAVDHGAVVLNQASVVAVTRDGNGLARGVIVHDAIAGDERHVQGAVVVNACGPFSDELRRMDDTQAEPMLAPSQGVHVVLDASFLPNDHAIMVPHTSDGRVLFALPWHGRALVGTTDTPVERAVLEPVPFDEEIEWILHTARGYLAQPPRRADVLSCFAGIRPLVAAGSGAPTASLSRDHTVHVSPSGLLTVCGGKWTTWRRMAEDAVDHAELLGNLQERPCRTTDLPIHGALPDADRFGHLSVYGSDASALLELARESPEFAQPLHPRLPALRAEIVWAARHELAQTLDDVLARRTRSLVLDTRAALEAAPAAARLLAEELGRDAAWQHQQVVEFSRLAAAYLPR